MGEKPNTPPGQGQNFNQNFNIDVPPDSGYGYQNKPDMNQIYSQNPNLNQQPEQRMIVPEQVPQQLTPPAREERKAEKIAPLSKETIKSDNGNSLERIKYNNAEILDEKEIQDKKSKVEKKEVKIVKSNLALQKGYHVQLGYFKNEANAKRCLNDFKKNSPKELRESFKIIKIKSDGGDRYLVASGPHKNKQEAEKILQKVRGDEIFRDSFILYKE